MAISANALTTLVKLKRFMRITVSTDDTLLEEIIDSVSLFIERVCGRNFLARAYRQRFDGIHQRQLVLDHYPIQTITRVAYGDAQAMSLTYTGSGIRANAAIYKPDSLDTSGGLRLVSVGTTGTSTASNLSFSTNGSCTALETAIEAVSGWGATVLTNVPSLDLNPIIGGDALNRSVFLTYPDQDDVEYTANYERGILEFTRTGDYWFGRYARTPARETRPFPRGFQNFLIEYNAGYATIPADVELVCNQIANQVFFEGEDNPTIKSETTGPYSVTFTDGVLAGQIREQLGHYIDGRAMIGG